jgi:hypothetical protein
MRFITETIFRALWAFFNATFPQFDGRFVINQDGTLNDELTLYGFWSEHQFVENQFQVDILIDSNVVYYGVMLNTISDWEEQQQIPLNERIVEDNGVAVMNMYVQIQFKSILLSHIRELYRRSNPISTIIIDTEDLKEEEE